MLRGTDVRIFSSDTFPKANTLGLGLNRCLRGERPAMVRSSSLYDILTV